MFVYILLCVAALAIIVAVVETRIIRVKHYVIHSDRTDLGKSAKNIKIALVSDLHCTRFGKNNRRLINKITSQDFDFLIVAGDVINGRPDDLKYAVEFFDAVKEKGIKAYYTYGNHEQKLSLIDDAALDDYESAIKDHVEIVNNDTVVSDGITLKGLLIPLCMYRDKFDNIKNYFNAEKLVGKFANDGNYHILVAHDPTFASMYKEIGADLIVSGHLHGGILRIPFIGGVISPRHELFPRRTRGLYDEGNAKLLVSSGIGWHAIPLRFCNDPQICVIEISNNDRKI